MIPTVAFLPILFVSIAISVAAGYKLREFLDRRLNGLPEFKAYSDEELESQRKSTAGIIRYRLDHGFRSITGGHIRQLKKIDREIARRNREKNRQKILEQSKMSRTMQELARFDEVFAALEGKKENK